MPTTTPTSPPLVCPPLPPVRPSDVRSARQQPRHVATGRQRRWQLVRALLGIEAHAARRGGPAADQVRKCVRDLIAGPAGLLFRRADRWGMAYYLANVTGAEAVGSGVDRRGTWERHFIIETAAGEGGVFGRPLKEQRIKRGRGSVSPGHRPRQK